MVLFLLKINMFFGSCVVFVAGGFVFVDGNIVFVVSVVF